MQHCGGGNGALPAWEVGASADLGLSNNLESGAGARASAPGFGLHFRVESVYDRSAVAKS
jgi:hypothetical protein